MYLEHLGPWETPMRTCVSLEPSIEFCTYVERWNMDIDRTYYDERLNRNIFP